MRRAGGLLLAAATLLGGCRTPPESRSYREDSPPRQALPGGAQVLQAVSELSEKIRMLYPRWPAHLPHSRDFPTQPLVRICPLEDPEALGADEVGLQHALEVAVREAGLLRLLADERAVPSSLREPAPTPLEEEVRQDALDRPGAPAGEAEPPPPPAPSDEVWRGLELRPRLDRVGRYRLELVDASADKTLLRATAEAPTPER